MNTVSIAGHKGGIGKSTIVILLAQIAMQDNKRVVLIDLDPQKSLTQWWECRPDDDPQLIALNSHEELKKAIDILSPDNDLLIIDTPPAHQTIIQTAIQHSDLVIVPCSPSPIDIKGIGETITLLEELKKPFFFVLNRVNTRTRIASDTLKLLSQYGRVAPASLGMRIDYAQCTLDGKTPLDSGNQKIKEEVTALYKYLKEQLRRNK